jgi:hypothetical protein
LNIPYPLDGDHAWDMVRQPSNGYIIVAGTAGEGIFNPGNAFAMARFDSYGNLDPNFGSGGIVTRSVGHISWGRSVALQTNGMIVFAGFITLEGQPAGTSFHVMRFSASGAFHDEIDSTFPYGTGHGQQAWSVLVDPQDRIVAAGFHTQWHLCPESAPVTDAGFAAIRVYDAGTGAPSGGGGGAGGSFPQGAAVLPFAGTALGTFERGTSTIADRQETMAIETVSGPGPLALWESPLSAETGLSPSVYVQDESTDAAFAALDPLQIDPIGNVL